MPTYEYACRKCGEHLEVVQSFKDEPLTVCPNCKGALRKVFGNIGITFKGSGFYKTDSRGKSSVASKSADGSGAGTSSGGDSKSGSNGSGSSSGSSGSGSSGSGSSGGKSADSGSSSASSSSGGSGSSSAAS